MEHIFIGWSLVDDPEAIGAIFLVQSLLVLESTDQLLQDVVDLLLAAEDAVAQRALVGHFTVVADAPTLDKSLIDF